MNDRKYVIAVAPNLDFIGPLQSGSLEDKTRYVSNFEGNLTGFLEKLTPGVRQYWTSTKHSSKDKFPEIIDLSYVSNPSEGAMAFDSPAMAHLFTIYLKTFFPNNHPSAKFSVVELKPVNSERHPVNCC